jgi:hypothetical protein
VGQQAADPAWAAFSDFSLSNLIQLSNVIWTMNGVILEHDGKIFLDVIPKNQEECFQGLTFWCDMVGF